MKIIKKKLSEIKNNPNNPRIIKDDKFKKLVQSIKDFPEMLDIRPIVVNNIKYNKILRFEGYLFGEDGSVVSLKKGVKEIKGSPDKDGYLKISIALSNGKYKYCRKHRLIMEAFCGESNLEVNHKDSNKFNNSLDNLEYVSLRENQCHRRLKEGYEIGVCWANKEKKWRAYIQMNKVWEHLGFYVDKNDAKQAYINRLRELKIENRYADN
jgi:hypothetical protein